MGILSHVITLAAGLSGAVVVVCYCIHFDRKRRSDPDFRTKLRERRRKQREAKEAAELSKIPDLRDAAAVQKFYLDEFLLGELMMAQQDYKKGVEKY